jgi:DNA polymerase III delta prime subunit
MTDTVSFLKGLTMIGIRSHFSAGTGAIAIETREEKRALADIIAELPATALIATIAAPSGALKNARTGKDIDTPSKGLVAAYGWASAAPSRVLVVFDFHTLINAAGNWRALIEALPGLRQPEGDRDAPASLVIFIAPAFDLTPVNPLRGSLPILGYAPPDRAAIEAIVASLAPLPASSKDQVIDALCGLSAESIEQAAAEVLARGQGWNVAALRGARRQELKTAGLELWDPIADLGGLGGFRSFAEEEVFPWLRDPQLSVRRLLCAGLPGTGKSYSARWLAHRLGCECARLSIPSLKAGIVGASEGNLRRALRVIDSIAAHAPLVVVLDEIDTIARDGLDGGTSSGMFAELLTWLQESTSQTLVLATLNRLDKLDAALESRFQGKFFVDLPTRNERQAVAEIHFKRLGCAEPADAAKNVAAATEGFSSREIAEQLIPSIARKTNRNPDVDTIAKLAAGITPASRSQGEQLKVMRSAASSLRRANDPEAHAAPQAGRRIDSNKN